MFVLLNSCTTLYIPDAINAPLLAEKGDGKIAVGFGEEGHTGLMGAYAFTDHFLMTLNSSVSGFGGSFGDVGGGYYTTFGQPGFRGNKGRFEVLAGVGAGNSSGGNYEQYTRVFLQPSVGMATKNFDISFSLRWSHLNFAGVPANANLFSGGIVQSENAAQFSTVEPVVTVAGGGKHFKPFLQLRAISALGQTGNVRISGNPVIFGFKVDLWRKKKNAQPPVAAAVPVPPIRPELVPEERPEEMTASQTQGVSGARTLKICLRYNGTPDWDVVTVSYEGQVVAQNITLEKQDKCFDLPLFPDGEKKLTVQVVSEGKVSLATLVLTIFDGSAEQSFVVAAKPGEPIEIVFEIGKQ